MRRYSVLVVDDHASYRNALCRLIATRDQLTTVGETGDCHEAIRLAETHRPDLILIDAGLPGATGPCIARFLQKQGDTASIVLLSMELTHTRLIEAMRAGASGYLCKLADAGSLVQDIERVAEGNNLFTEIIRASPGLATRVRDEFHIVTVGGSLGEGAGQPLSMREAEILERIELSHHQPALNQQHAIDSVSGDPLEQIVRKLVINDRLELAAVAAHHDWLDGGVSSRLASELAASF